MERKKRQHELRKNDIALMVEKACYEHGYLNLTMEQLAKFAGYTKKSLYNYFRSKEEIYAVVYLSGLSKRILFIEKKVAQFATGIEKLICFGQAYYEFYKENPEILDHQLIADSKLVSLDAVNKALLTQIGESNDQGRAMILSIFKQGIKDKTIRSDVDISSAFFHYIYSLRAIASRAVDNRIWDVADTNNEMDADKWFQDFLSILIENYKNKSIEHKAI